MKHNTHTLFLCHTGETGGAELSLLDLITRRTGKSEVVLFADGPFREKLCDAGVSVSLIEMGRELLAIKRDAPLGPLIASLIRSSPATAKGLWRLAKLARSTELLYANSQKTLVIGAIVSGLTNRPLIWHMRDMMTAEHFGSNQRALSAWTGNHFANGIIANSRSTADAFITAGGNPKKVKVIYNGFDPAPFDDADPATVATIRQDLGIGSSPLIGVFSRLAPWKGQHVLIRALESIPGAHALIVGGPLFGEQKYESELHSLVAALGLSQRVHFVGFKSDVTAYYLAADIVAHTSVSAEPFGRVIVEGMLARKPVIATAAGGAREIIENRKTGLLVPPDDPAALAAAIRELLNDSALRAKQASLGRDSALARFSISANIEQIENFMVRTLPPRET